jgi:LAO/AO transport system kinase
VVRAVATRQEGIGEILAAIDKHRDWLRTHDQLAGRRRRRAAAEIEAIVLAAIRERVEALDDRAALPARAAAVAAGDQDPYAAAEAILAGLGIR